ncbi:uncharacterized protein LOC111614457, partial [Centruroides sculpturatus]|uniref:uncharacterized protein LOC111614457 n=1 Tax=Centruroides sculpturatus TaxID=218467 RepID=UPI000C6EA035
YDHIRPPRGNNNRVLQSPTVRTANSGIITNTSRMASPSSETSSWNSHQTAWSTPALQNTDKTDHSSGSGINTRGQSVYHWYQPQITVLSIIMKGIRSKHINVMIYTIFVCMIVIACPECRVLSDFVTPSRYWVETKEEKEKLIEDYKKALSSKPCKYFKQGRGECPFAGACFYLHAYPDGTKAQLPPPRPRRRRNQDGDLETMERIFLWDFFEVRDDQLLLQVDIEEMLDLFSDTEDESDWSDLDVLID